MPKGKKKAEEPVKFTQKADVMPPLKMDQSPKPWSPSPDMGNITPPAPAEKVCGNCPHKKETHYGRSTDWCNVGGCECQSFK